MKTDERSAQGESTVSLSSSLSLSLTCPHSSLKHYLFSHIYYNMLLSWVWQCHLLVLAVLPVHWWLYAFICSPVTSVTCYTHVKYLFELDIMTNVPVNIDFLGQCVCGQEDTDAFQCQRPWKQDRTDLSASLWKHCVLPLVLHMIPLHEHWHRIMAIRCSY